MWGRPFLWKVESSSKFRTKVHRCGRQKTAPSSSQEGSCSKRTRPSLRKGKLFSTENSMDVIVYTWLSNKKTYIYTLTFRTLEISRVRMQTPGLPVTWGKIPGFSNKSWVCRKNPGFSPLCRNFQILLGMGRIWWVVHIFSGKPQFEYPFRMAICASESSWVVQ